MGSVSRAHHVAFILNIVFTFRCWLYTTETVKGAIAARDIGIVPLWRVGFMYKVNVLPIAMVAEHALAKSQYYHYEEQDRE